VLLAGCLLSLVWLVHPWYEAGDETNDAAIYVACARALLSGAGYSYLGEPFTVRPPGMSALIAPVLAARGSDWHALNLLVALFGVACVGLLFAHTRARIGTGLALLVAAALWLSDPFQRLCNQVMSDVPGAALLLACLLVERWAARRPSVARDVVLGACIGLATYVRSVTILLVPAIAAARVLRRWARRGDPGAEPWSRVLLAGLAPLALSAFLVKLPWDVRCALHHPAPPVDQNYLYSYSTAMWHVDGGDPSSPARGLGEIAARVPGRAVQVLSLLGSGMRDSDGGAAAALGAVVLLLAAVAAWRRRESAELFALLVLGVLLVYFGFRDRLALPIWVLALPAAAEGALVLARRPLGERNATLAAAGVLLALPVLCFHPRRDWDRIEAAHAFYQRYAAEVRAAVPEDVRVASQIGWHLSVYLDRPVWSLFFAARRAGGPAGALAVVERHGIGAIALSPRIEADRKALPWLAERFGPPVVAAESVVLRTRR
jgi:hypothetical protein